MNRAWLASCCSQSVQDAQTERCQNGLLTPQKKDGDEIWRRRRKTGSYQRQVSTEELDKELFSGSISCESWGLCTVFHLLMETSKSFFLYMLFFAAYFHDGPTF